MGYLVVVDEDVVDVVVDKGTRSAEVCVIPPELLMGVLVAVVVELVVEVDEPSVKSVQLSNFR